MKFLVVLAAAIACVCAAVLTPDSQSPIVRSDFHSKPDGDFQFGYETGNGITHEVGGVIKDQNSENPILEEKGVFKYTAPDGTPIELGYIANEYGFQPIGSHLPTPPPTPEAITRLLAYIAAHPPQAEKAASAKYVQGSGIGGGSGIAGGSGFGGGSGTGRRTTIDYKIVTVTDKIPVVKYL